jgi:phosphatidylinositol 4-kinase A
MSRLCEQAGYAVASYIVQSKDRHNGNILLDSAGRIVHIDFGFIFEISPGGNLGFERAAFKFSHEMVQLIDPGAQQQSTQYTYFKELCVRGYLAARTVAQDVLAAAALMARCGLPCYGRGKPLENLEARFMLDKSPAEAAAFMRAAVDGAHNSFTTGFYDYIQARSDPCMFLRGLNAMLYVSVTRCLTCPTAAKSMVTLAAAHVGSGTPACMDPKLLDYNLAGL